MIPINVTSENRANDQCGNGIFNPQRGEECDDGNTLLEACDYGQVRCMVCDATCRIVEGQISRCGDGVVDLLAAEECDEGESPPLSCSEGQTSCQLCTSQCQSVYVECGDGVTDEAYGERCDDGNTEEGDGCDAQCQQEYCGNGVRQPHLGEECADGNRLDGDGCDAYCFTLCGNGVVDRTELCDDGNLMSGD